MASNEAVAAPGARASARYVRVSPMKARRVVDLIRGLTADEALTRLEFTPLAASEPVYKVVASAIANAENNESLDRESLLISEAFVDEGPTMKRYRPRAHGRAYRIRKRTSHITVALEAVQAGERSSGPSMRRPKRRKADSGGSAKPDSASKTDKDTAEKETE